MAEYKVNQILHGGDYNPDQWPEEVWDQDMRLFEMAGITVATLPVFSWSKLQPSENKYDFSWLDKIIEKLQNAGIKLCLATSTAAVPPWMAKNYPDVLRVNQEGLKRGYGIRHNFCPNSVSFRRFSSQMAERMAVRYGEHPSLALWHVNNEYGGRCHCENCGNAFRKWLRERYNTLDELNEKWYTAFWSHTFHDWDEIPVPTYLTELFRGNPSRTSAQGHVLDYWRFQSESLLQCFQNEAKVLRQITPDIPITTNLMGTYEMIDSFQWGPELDIVSWDSYPQLNENPHKNGFAHSLMRGVKGGDPFLLMEQSPSQVNWSAYNQLRPDGDLRLKSFQAVAHGAESVMYFQLRRSRGSGEKFHGAVIDHCNHENTRVFREVSRLGEELKQLGDQTIGSRNENKVAILYDWNIRWALNLSLGPSRDLNYLNLCTEMYTSLLNKGLGCDIIHPSHDFSRYSAVFAPVCYMVDDDFGSKVENYVNQGGHFMTTFFSGLVDDNDRIRMGGNPVVLRKVLGLWVEETDALLPDEKNAMVFNSSSGFKGKAECGLLCDRIHLEGAEELAAYEKNFYAKTPVFTKNNFGKGVAWYLGSWPESGKLEEIASHICEKASVKPHVPNPPGGVEVTLRTKGDKRLLFLLNHNRSASRVKAPGLKGKDLLTQNSVSETISLEANGVAIIELQ